MDIKALLQSKNIPYVEKGKNVMRNHVAIRCFECDDKSNHLNIKVDGTHALCFRCGFRVYGLKNVLKLFGVNFKNIKKFYFNKVSIGDVVEENKIIDLGHKKKRLRMLYETFLSIKKSKYVLNYLNSRGVSFDFADKLGFRVGVGGWEYFLMIPVYYPNGDLVNLIGRDVTGRLDQRYKNAPSEIAVDKDCCYGIYESIKFISGINYIVIVEGVFDCVKLLQVGVPSLALLTKTASHKKLSMIVDSFNKDVVVFLCLDADVVLKEVLNLKLRLLSFFNVVYSVGFKGNIGRDIILPFNVKDVGDLDDVKLCMLKAELLKNV